jgi:putative iron-dependent peroxidase
MQSRLNQPAVLAPVPAVARYLSFRLLPGIDDSTLSAALAHVASMSDGLQTVVGIGSSTVARLGCQIAGLHEVPAFEGALEPIATTPQALWLWLRGDERGELLHRGLNLTVLLDSAFVLETVTDAFFYAGGRDLTGYEQGTGNPKAEAAIDAALLTSGGPGLEGSSFAAVQHWQHDLLRFAGLQPSEQDQIVGRRLEDNEELPHAPESAHIKRTAQHSFRPSAYLLRRAMPWVHGQASGIEFVAFGSSFYAFEAQLRRMVGLEDGVIDGLFRFSRPLTTSYYWCPPLHDGLLDLRALGISPLVS